nr:MAG: major capsid protein [Microvirus sp.]
MAKRSYYPDGVNISNPNFSRFDLSHLHRTSFDMGKIIPIDIQAVMPGDSFNINVEHFIRTMPTLVPIMDNVDLKVNHFFVPYRILWDKFPEWLTMSDTYKLSGAKKPEIPKFQMAPKPTNKIGESTPKYPNGRLADYLGLPSVWSGKQTSSVEEVPEKDFFNMFPLLAYHKIVLDWYSPQRWVEYLNASDDANHSLYQLKKMLHYFKTSPGGKNYGWIANTTNTYVNQLFKVRNVNWNNDLFTQALPTATLFNDVKIPFLNDNAASFGDGFRLSDYDDGQITTEVIPRKGIDSNDGSFFDNSEKMATIRQLRENIAFQHFLETMQQGGGRYMETMKLIWGQDIPDATLQLSEYLGGDVTPIFFNEVESNAGTDANALGDVAGKPISGGRGSNINFKADEFGVYLCLAHVVPKRSYSDAIDIKVWKFDEPTDLPMKHFENLGDEAIYSSELIGSNGIDGQIFGYIPRYLRWKGSIDRYSGELRHTLKHWHLGTTSQEIGNYPTISPAFLEAKPRMDIFNVNDGETDNIFGVFNFDIQVNRGLTYNPQPGLQYI